MTPKQKKPAKDLNPPSDAQRERFDKKQFEEKIRRDLQDAQELLSGSNRALGQDNDATWEVAAKIVSRVRPIPWLFWVLIRSVYGKSGELGSPGPASFAIANNLILRAAADSSFCPNISDHTQAEVRSPTDAVRVVGVDVVGALCFMHAVCRRVCTLLNRRVWQPILDDALLRAHIGYDLGRVSPMFGAGRGMLSGFAGRCGLAIQIASGSMEKAQTALAALASGTEISEVCAKFYHCDPLQVSALSLISGGCSRDIALGIAGYSGGRDGIVFGTEQYQWLAAFSIIENLRSGRKQEILENYWASLGYNTQERKQELFSLVQQVQRRGHGWRWIVGSMTDSEDEEE